MLICWLAQGCLAQRSVFKYLMLFTVTCQGIHLTYRQQYLMCKPDIFCDWSEDLNVIFEVKVGVTEETAMSSHNLN